MTRVFANGAEFGLSGKMIGLEQEMASVLQRRGRKSSTMLPRVWEPLAIPVAGISRPIEVKFASTQFEWEQALQLAASCYQARGYEPPGANRLRFTPYHALPDTRTVVAKHKGRVVGTLSLVQDNMLLGLPMEDVYAQEIRALRQEGARLFEVTTLADEGLGIREFVPIFIALIRLATQYHTGQGGDTGVIAVNPRHRQFYTRVLGFERLGPRRTYAAVQDNPAEAFWITETLMRATAPRIHETIFAESLPREVLCGPKMPHRLVQQFSAQSSLCDPALIEKILAFREQYGSLRRW